MKNVVFVFLTAIALLPFASMSRADDVLRMKPGIATMVRVPGAEKGNLKAIVGRPETADVAFGPNNVFWFIGKKAGTTNIIVVNELTAAEVYNATIEVLPEDTPPPPERKNIISIMIFPKTAGDPMISREFYCAPGCTYILPKAGSFYPSSVLTSDLVSRSNTTIQTDGKYGGTSETRGTTTITTDPQN